MSVDPKNVIRVTPPTGSDHALAANRDHTTGVGLLTAQDLSVTTSGRLGVWMGHRMIVGECSDHGEVADEAAMLTLHDWPDDPHTRAVYHYVAPGDSCTRADDPGYRYHCLRGHGLYASDWERRPLSDVVDQLRTDVDALNIDLDDKQPLSSALTTLSGVDLTNVGISFLGLGAPATDPRLASISADGSVDLVSVSQVLDLIGSATHGDILYRGASGWTRLGAGSVGQLLRTGGAGANPSWATISGAGDVVGPSSATADTIPVFDGTTGKLIKAQGVATISSGRLRVKSSGVAQMIHAVNDSGSSQADITATTYGRDGGGIFHGRLANGTEASPTKVTSGQIVGGYGGRAYYGSTGFHASSPASIHMVAAETQEDSAWGMYLRFLTTPVGSTTRRERVVIAPIGTLWAHDEATYDPRVTAQTKPVADVQILASGASGGGTSIGVFSYGTGTAGFRGGLADGTPASPGATPADRILSFMGGHVHDGAGWSIGTKALLAFKTAQTATPSAQGTYITLETTPLNSTARAERARVSPAGNLLVGTTDDTAGFANADGNIKVKNSVVFEGGGTGRGIRYQATTANGTVATTMGSVGPAGATAGPPSGWFRMYSGTAGRDVFVPYW